MVTAQFKSGNFNKWENFSNNLLPSKNQFIRHALIPLIENTLESMLGERANIEKESIDIAQVCDKDILSAINCTLTYYVEDFKAPDVPKKAVDADQNSIFKTLNISEASLQEVNIDINTGILKVVYLISLFEE